MGRGLAQEQATAAARQIAEGNPDVVGDGIAEIPLAVASSPDVDAFGADMLVTYRNFGRVRLWGADLAATLLLAGPWSVGLTGSYVSDDHFRIPLQGVEQILALNAPALKGTASLRYRNPESRLGGEVRVRYHDAFPASSAGYVGLACAGVADSASCVDGATLADITLGYRLPGVRGASLQLAVQNVFDTPYRPFVRVPVMGRLALLRVAYEF
jgi:outer membrane receptor protein involved in Fe transport